MNLAKDWAIHRILITSSSGHCILNTMASKLWDVCEPDAEQTALLEELDFLVRGVGLSRKSSGEEDYPVLSPGEERSSDPETCSSSVIKGDCFSCDEIHDSLHTVEQACKLFIDNVDDILGVLEKVEQAHSDVTGRTNILMLNCETLLEQQHALQDVVDQLRDIITPFNDVEAVAGTYAHFLSFTSHQLLIRIHFILLIVYLLYTRPSRHTR